MRDIMSVQKTVRKDGATVTRIRVIPANKYSARYMELKQKVKQ